MSKNDELVDSTTLGYQVGEAIKCLYVVCVCVVQPTTTNNNQQQLTTNNKIGRGEIHERGNEGRVLLWQGADERAVRFHGLLNLSAADRSDALVVCRD